jgi:hypothetical protein
LPHLLGPASAEGRYPMTEDRRYPLCWPDGWKRTIRRRRAAYKVNEETAKQQLMHSLSLLGAGGVILSSNIRLRNDGLPYSNQPRLDDPGVAVYFKRKGKEQVIACDTWDLIKDNYRAVWMAVEAMRSIERCGASELLDRAFTGFAALPPPPTALATDWRSELGLSFHPNPTREDVESAFRRLAKERHPDVVGGSAEAFRALVAAYQTALREIGEAR